MLRLERQQRRQAKARGTDAEHAAACSDRSDPDWPWWQWSTTRRTLLITRSTVNCGPATPQRSVNARYGSRTPGHSTRPPKRANKNALVTRGTC